MGLPNIAVFVPGKQKAARLIGTFNEDDINSFLENMSRGKISTVDYEKVTFNNRDCKEFYLNLERNSEESNDELVQEILREEEERRRALGLEDTEKSKSKRKKRRGKDKSDDL